jgi:hypothetical protein
MLRPSLPRGSCTPAIPPVPAVRRTVTIRPTEASKAAVRYVRNTSTPATVLVLNLLLNCGQRNINFAAARLELRSRRARKLLRETFLDEKHPEASARRLSNERPSLLAPFEMKCTATLIDFRRNIHASVGDCQRPVFARIRTQFIDRHNEGKRCSGINSYRRGLDSELLATTCFKRLNRRFPGIVAR